MQSFIFGSVVFLFLSLVLTYAVVQTRVMIGEWREDSRSQGVGNGSKIRFLDWLLR